MSINNDGVGAIYKRKKQIKYTFFVDEKIGESKETFSFLL